MDKIGVVILAAGKGTRLNNGQPSLFPKVLYDISGKPMIKYVLETLDKMKMKNIVIVVGYKSKKVKEVLDNKYSYTLQRKQLGTGHAVTMVKPQLAGKVEQVLVLQGDDSAFYKKGTLLNLIKFHQKNKETLTFLTVEVENPGGLGRILRGQKGQVLGIIEKEFLTKEQGKIKEINAGCYIFAANWLWNNLKKIKKGPTGEYFLPDLIKIAIKEGEKVRALKIDKSEWAGVNNLEQLMDANKQMKKRLRIKNKQLV